MSQPDRENLLPRRLLQIEARYSDAQGIVYGVVASMNRRAYGAKGEWSGA